jgi:hypothetical protein
MFKATAVCAQEWVIDLKEVKQVLQVWVSAHNQKNIGVLGELYADTVLFYAKKLPRASCQRVKAKIFQSQREFQFEITGNTEVKVFDSKIIRISFVRRVTSDITLKDYDGYLLIKRLDKRYTIIGESDNNEDGRAKFSPDLGKELKSTLLSEDTSQIDPSPMQDASEAKNSITPYFIYSGGGLLLVFLLVAVYRRTSGKKPTIQDEISRTKEKAYSDGFAFEQFVVSRFDKKYFHLLDWTSDKISGTTYALSSRNPDLAYEFRLGEYSKQFAVECKYRKYLMNGVFELDPRQLVNYRRFQKERKLAVFVVLGTGGGPSAPADMFILPLELFEENNFIHYDLSHTTIIIRRTTCSSTAKGRDLGYVESLVRSSKKGHRLLAFFSFDCSIMAIMLITQIMVNFDFFSSTNRPTVFERQRRPTVPTPVLLLQILVLRPSWRLN